MNTTRISWGIEWKPNQIAEIEIWELRNLWDLKGECNPSMILYIPWESNPKSNCKNESWLKNPSFYRELERELRKINVDMN